MQSAGFWKQSWNTFKRICALPLIALVKFYQLCISPFTPPSCRFTPTCSQYALEALRKYGPLKGLWLSLRRLAAIRGEAAVTTRYPEPAGRQSPKGTNAARDNKNNPTFRGRIVFSDSIHATRRAEKPEEPAKGRHTVPPGR